MERKHRHLDREGEEKSPEQPALQLKREERVRRLENVLDAERVCVEINRQNREQHQHRASQRIEEKLDRSIETPLAAPHADQEVHRYQHHFPENVKQDEIERHKDAQHACLKQKKQDVILFLAFFDR